MVLAAVIAWAGANTMLASAGVGVVVLAALMWPLLPGGRAPTKPPAMAEGTRTVAPANAEERRVLDGLSPTTTVAQKRAALVYHRTEAARGTAGRGVPRRCVVTGGTGFVGQRLVEMLVERGAEKVICFDIVPAPADAWRHPAVEYVIGDITNKAQITAAVKGADCVWHNAACVGPFHPLELYDKVNFHGTLNVLDACRAAGVPKIVMSSSPSTRFDGSDIDGLTEAQMPSLPLSSYLQAYAGSKARGEMALTAASCDELLTVAVAPHQVYGPRDNLFMPNVLEAAGSGMLRVFAAGSTGWGRNRVCFTHVDNYAHALILAERALVPGSPAAGKFYIATDGDSHPSSEGYAYFWDAMDEIVVAMGFQSVWARVKLPTWLLYPVAYACNVIGMLLRRRLKLNPFNVRMLTMHRWFRINAAVKDLGYYPVVPFAEGWADAAVWTRENWLPGFQARSRGGGGVVGIAAQSQRKIDIQADSALGSETGAGAKKSD